MAVPTPPGTIQDMKARRVAAVIVMVLLLVLLVAPVYILKAQLRETRDSGPAAQLTAIAKSLAGDRTADDLAAQALARATRVVVDGTERFRISNGTVCWEVEPSRSDEPYRCTS